MVTDVNVSFEVSTNSAMQVNHCGVNALSGQRVTSDKRQTHETIAMVSEKAHSNSRDQTLCSAFKERGSTRNMYGAFTGNRSHHLKLSDVRGLVD